MRKSERNVKTRELTSGFFAKYKNKCNDMLVVYAAKRAKLKKVLKRKHLLLIQECIQERWQI